MASFLFYLSLMVSCVGTEWLRICNHPKSTVHDCVLAGCLPMLPYKEYERIKNIPQYAARGISDVPIFFIYDSYVLTSCLIALRLGSLHYAVNVCAVLPGMS